MRRFVISATISMVVGLGAVVAAQSKIATAADYATLMKSNGQAFGGTNKAIASGAYADARTQLATLRQNYVQLQTFWEEKKVPDAVGIVKGALTNIDALNTLLSAPTVDQMAAQAAAKQVQGSCGACHKTQRDGDPQTGFRFKPGVF